MGRLLAAPPQDPCRGSQRRGSAAWTGGPPPAPPPHPGPAGEFHGPRQRSQCATSPRRTWQPRAHLRARRALPRPGDGRDRIRFIELVGNNLIRSISLAHDFSFIF